MDLNFAHVHLLLNHTPTIGFGIGILLYIVAYFGKNESLKKTSLVILFLIAVLAIPTYVSGNAAERTLCPDHKCPAGVNVMTIRAHEDAALGAFALMEVTGFFAWLALWQLRTKERIGSWNWNLILVLALGTFGMMALAANEGGDIRHSEIREGQQVAEVPADSPDGTGVARSIGAAVAGNTGQGWIWPTCETLHFVGLCMLFMTVLTVDLRILGVGKGLSFKALYALLPLGMVGFCINLITGMLFFLGAPGQYIHNPEFQRKMVFVVLAGVNVLYFMIGDETWKLGEQDDAPMRAKIAAVLAIYLWVGVLYYGHMLPFLGNSF